MAQTALITGASGGIGVEFARLFARDGYNVVLVARNLEKLEAVAAELRGAFGIETLTLQADLSAPGAAAKLFDDVQNRGLQIDALVNNAGFGYDARFVESDLDRHRALVQTNDMALMELCHLFGAPMAARGDGRILNVASMAAFMPGTYMSTYYASKAFVASFSSALHVELRGRGVHVTVLCPGPMRTNFWNAADADSSILGHLLANPKRVARGAYWCLKVNKAQCIPWIFPKIVVFLTRFLPRSVLAWATALLDRA